MLIGIISDAHGNYEAFKRCIKKTQELGCEEIYFLGDSIGYIPSISVLEYLYKNKDIKCVLGNHEKMLLEDIFNTKKDEIYQLGKVKYKTEKNHIDYVSQWPEYIELSTQAGRVLLVHGSPNNPKNGYVYPDSDLSDFKHINYDYIFMGHTHRPFSKKYNNKHFINVGSSGLPRDNGSSASFCTFNTINGDYNLHKIDISDINKNLTKNFTLHKKVIELFDRK